MKQSNFTLQQFAIEVGGEAYSFTINQVLMLRYVEDIQSATIRMEAQITDSQNGILSKIEGMEPVVITISDEDKNILEAQMVVYDVQDRVMTPLTSKITILLCTRDQINNTAIKVSKRFGPGEGTNIGDLVEKNILQELLATEVPIDVQPTLNKYSFISPYWTPLTMIRWLATKAIAEPEQGGIPSASAGYAFFQNKDGYVFWSYDKLASQELTTSAANKFILGYLEGELEDMGEKLAIDKMTVKSSNDILQGMNYGSYVSTVMTLDLKDMKYEEHPFDVNKYYTAVPRLNQETPVPPYFDNFDEKSYTRVMSKLLDTALFTEGTLTQDTTKHISQSTLREKLFYNRCVEVEFVGKLDHKVGDVIELSTFTGPDKDVDSTSGKYIIGRIEREFYSRNDQMTTKMLLYTDSPTV